MPVHRIIYEQLCALYGEKIVKRFYVPMRPIW